MSVCLCLCAAGPLFFYARLCHLNSGSVHLSFIFCTFGFTVVTYFVFLCGLNSGSGSVLCVFVCVFVFPCEMSSGSVFSVLQSLMSREEMKE